MRGRLLALSVVAALAVAACGGENSEERAGPRPTASPTREPARPVVDVTGGMTTLRIDQEARRFLGLVGVELSATGEADERDGALRFPITGGRLSLKPGQGGIEHAGGLRIRAGGRHVDATGLIARPASNVVTAEIEGRRVPLLRLTGNRPTALPAAGERVVISARASVVGESVLAALGSRLNVEELTRGLPLGELEISAET